ncbi:MAG: hypothetical protein ACFCUO_11300 [Rhodospirillales bacterium]
MTAERRYRRWVLAGGLAVGLAAGSPPSAAVAAGSCVNQKDLAALNARVLQTELMVAALTCGERARYNAFVMGFRGELGKHGHALRSLFNRLHGARGTNELNGFVTRLANDASHSSIAIRPEYCAIASALFEEVLNVPVADFDVVADKPWVGSRHGFRPCTRTAEQDARDKAAQARTVKAN